MASLVAVNFYFKDSSQTALQFNHLVPLPINNKQTTIYVALSDLCLFQGCSIASP